MKNILLALSLSLVVAPSVFANVEALVEETLVKLEEEANKVLAANAEASASENEATPLQA